MEQWTCDHEPNTGKNEQQTAEQTDPWEHGTSLPSLNESPFIRHGASMP